jgi:hypothetical protein
MESDMIADLFFSAKDMSAQLLVNSATFHDTGKVEAMSKGLSGLHSRAREALGWDTPTCAPPGPAPAGMGPLEAKALSLFALVLEPKAPREGKAAEAISGLHREIKGAAGTGQEELSAVADFLMAMRCVREGDTGGALGFLSAMPAGSPHARVRLLRAVASGALVSACLSKMEIDRAVGVYEAMDRRPGALGGGPSLSVVGGPPLGRRPSGPRAAKLTLVGGPKGRPWRGLDLVGGIADILGRPDAEGIRMRAARNIIIFTAFQGDPLPGEGIWQRLAAEPWFKGSPEEASFATVMAYASALGADRRKALFHLGVFAGRHGDREVKALRARLLVTLMFAHQRRGEKRALQGAFGELESMGLGGDPELEGVRARASTLLLKQYSGERDFKRVKETFLGIGGLGANRDLDAESLRASVEIIETYAGMGELALTFSIFEPLNRLRALDDHNYQLVRASTALVDALVRQGRLREAKELFFYQRSLGLPRDGQALADGLGLCYSAMDLESVARDDLFRLEQGLRDGSFLMISRAKAAVTLMEALGRARDIKSLFSTYESFGPHERYRVKAFLRMGLIMSLFWARGGTKGHAPGPRGLRPSGCGVPAGQGGERMGLYSLVSRLCGMGDLRAARQAFERIPGADGSGGVDTFCMVSANVLTDSYLRAGDKEGVERMARFFLGLSPLEMRVMKAYRLRLRGWLYSLVADGALPAASGDLGVPGGDLGTC